MNNAGRKQIEVLAATLDNIRSSLADLKSEFETLASEEQEKYDNMTENLQSSERGERIYAAAEALGYIVESFDDMDSSIDDIQGYIDTATE